MPLPTGSFSMFHRRLVLLVCVIALGMLALSAQLVRLTVVQGAELRADAEGKLVNREWSYAGRGRILDRKGRVLAQDRPSFDLTVNYPVISGEWAQERAYKRAREQNREAWRGLTAEERSALADGYVAVYAAHVERMWDEVSRRTGVPRAKLDERLAQIRQRVEALRFSHYKRGLHRALDARLRAGEEISGELDEPTRLMLERPIQEEETPHVVLAKIPDAAGFNLLALAEQETEIAVPLPEGGSVQEKAPLMPGMAVVAAGDREYPLDSVTVEVATASLPEPVRAEIGGVGGVGAVGGEAGGVKRITVEGVAYHILGRMKPRAQGEDSKRRAERVEGDPAFAARVMTGEGGEGEEAGGAGRGAGGVDRGRYLEDDPAGLSGVEASREDELRGLRGLKVRNLETGREESVPPRQGEDVHLTLDVMLQARVQAAMSRELGLAVAQAWHYRDEQRNPTVPVGMPLNGAAVVLDVDSGEILAMVTTPSISRATLKDRPESVFADPMNLQADVPWIDRSIARPYPPGSIAKALVLTGAVKFGKLNLDTPIDCTGHLYPDKPDMFRCWIYKQFNGQVHGPLTAPEALTRSCNVYFFTLGQRLGPQGMTDTFAMYGLGQPWGLGTGLEYEGGIGERDAQGRRLPLGLSDATQMGIGQGPVAWTPLHAADAYATLARGGVRIRPRVIADGGTPEPMDLGLDPRAVRQALEGLKGSVNEQEGTGHHLYVGGRSLPHFNAPGVLVWGKTGTAQAPTIYVRETMEDPEHPGQRIPNPLWERGVDAATIIAASGDQSVRLPAGTRALRWGDHSWFVVLAGSKAQGRPQYAIAVMMEYAGSGGKVSGPIANQIIHALIAEGYL